MLNTCGFCLFWYKAFAYIISMTETTRTFRDHGGMRLKFCRALLEVTELLKHSGACWTYGPDRNTPRIYIGGADQGKLKTYVTRNCPRHCESLRLFCADRSAWSKIERYLLKHCNDILPFFRLSGEGRS
jgi:hypothetical protein